ncbi:uncharacterized protein LOC111641344 [Centruroides sculpturatus]|uniref:uncharacterized protein LOC111641344 n=1 Tax=Centruroides sculpturatus TaxID=218467 RepID=UPI000C6D9CA7|nr:uncharacterized protein LOC111641344 [Centruroides sculpturatus]
MQGNKQNSNDNASDNSTLSINSNYDVNSSHLRILQINMQRSKVASSLALKTANDLDINLLIIQEPYTLNNKIVSFGGWRILTTRNGEKPKSGIIVRDNNLDAALIPDLITQRITTIAIQQQPQLYILSIYFSPDDDDNNCIEELQYIIKSLNSDNFILVGETNAKSPIWYHYKEDHRGRLLIDLMDRYNLYSANTTDDPTFYTVYAEGWTDVFLVPVNKGNVMTCETLLWESLSDHRYIYAELSGITNKENYINYYKKYTNWELYKEIFAINWRNYRFNEIEDEESINQYTDHITKAIQEAKRLSTTITKTKQRDTVWWIDSLSTQQKKVRKFLKKLAKTTNEDKKNTLKEKYRKALKTYKKCIKYSRTNAWRELKKNPWDIPYRVVFNKKKKMSHSKYCQME